MVVEAKQESVKQETSPVKETSPIFKTEDKANGSTQPISKPSNGSSTPIKQSPAVITTPTIKSTPVKAPGKG